jgi:dUTP pyrophosphatase
MSYNINVKLLNEQSKVPTQAHEADAGYDLYSSESVTIVSGERRVVKTGIAFGMEEGLTGLIWPRSGLSVRSGIDVLAGVIDSGYLGEIKVCLLNTSIEDLKISMGDRIAQILFQEVPKVTLTVRNSLGASQRGGKGFGSSGK